MATQSNEAHVLASAANALRLLSSLTTTPSLRVVDVSRSLGVAPSSAHRLLSCLRDEGFVRQMADSKRYVVGPEMLRLARHFSAQNTLERVARPHLAALCHEVDETVNLHVLIKSDVLCLDAVAETRHDLHVKQIAGRRVAAHGTAAGKVLLAALSTEERDALYQDRELPPMTGNTIADRAQLEADLRTVRANGYATNLAEHEQGVNAVAVPVLDLDDVPIAAISIAAPAIRLPPARITRIVRDLRRTRAAITASFFAVDAT
jgi:DNA-binding IclR family transcriptional regulator